MKLVFLSPMHPIRGGIAQYGTHLLETLKRRHDCWGLGFSKLYPSILFPGKGGDGPDDMPESGTRAQDLLHYAKFSTWRSARQQILDFSPHGLIVSWWVTFWAPYFRWLTRRIPPSIPVIFLCHNVLPHEPRFFDPLLTRWVLRRGSGFIVHSEENRRQILNWFPGAQIIRRHHPVYSSDADLATPREEARRRLGVKGQILLFFGFVRPYKGVDVAIEAISLLRDELPDLSFWIAGEFWEDENRYHRLINKLGLAKRVKIEPGFLSGKELALRLSACDGVILPYRSATGSGALATAYAMNRPVIATRCGGFVDMVIPGETGILCEPGDARSLAEGIREFYSGSGPELFGNGIEKAKAAFTWDAIVDAIEELLDGK